MPESGRGRCDGREVTPHDGGVLARTLYRELRELAAAKMNREYSPQTLQATALVHEAWLRLGGDQQPRWSNTAQFFSASAEAMRRILVDRARNKKSQKRGGGWKRENFAFLDRERLGSSDEAGRILLVDEVLERLEAQDRESARLLELRYFAGVSVEETARVLGISKRTAERRLAYAKAWICRELERIERE